MNSLQARPVYILAASLINAAGTHCADLKEALPTAQPLEFAPERLAYSVPVPRLPTTVFDRKIQRSVEPQGARLLYCAAGIAGALKDLNLPDQRIALMAAIPEVDGPSCSWETIQAIAEHPEALLAQLFAYTPPLQALMMLNSTVMAYVAEALHCHGPMGGYCSQGNAGVDALMEAFEHVAHDRADAAVVVSSSPNLSPALYLRDSTEHPINANSEPHGEGAAALLLTSCPPARGTRCLRIAGIGRGYSASPERSGAVAQKVIQQALRGEQLNLHDVTRIVAAPEDSVLRQLFAQTVQMIDSASHKIGDLGASALLTDVAVALNDPTHRYTLLLNHSRADHWGALLLANDTKEPQHGLT